MGRKPESTHPNAAASPGTLLGPAPRAPASTRARSFIGLVLASALLVAPFALLQSVNRRTLHEDFPVVLFTFMSVHALLIVLFLSPVFAHLRAGGRPATLGIRRSVGLALCAVLVVAYVNVVADQMPCFLGVPDCD